MKKIFLALALYLPLLLESCSEKAVRDEEIIEKTAQDFATAFFHFQFQNAASYCTPESEKWIRYRASNITERDIASFNAAEEWPEVEAEDIEWNDDSTCIVTCLVSPYFCADSLEQTGFFQEEKSCRIPMVYRNGSWYVKMEGPLQSGE